MRARFRLAAVGVTVFLWALWLSVLYARFAQPDPHTLHIVGSFALMVAASLSTVALMLLFLVRPVIETATVWKEIGRREMAKECPHCDAGLAVSAAELADVIPMRMGGFVHAGRRERVEN